MIINRICEWARSQPTKPAIIYNDGTLTYADFARAVEFARRFFEKQDLPVGQTVITVPGTLLDAWVLVMSLRALGLNTVCIQSVEQANALKFRNLAGIVTSVKGLAQAFDGTALESVRKIVLPATIFSDTDASDLPVPPQNLPPLGGHILLTSGTTGTYKKLLLDGHNEDGRNAARAHAYSLTKNMIYRVGNLGLWTTIGFRMPLAVWHIGGCVVMDTRSDINDFFRYAVDLSIITPSVLKQLIQSPGTEPSHDSCELLITSGFLPLELAEETVRRVTKKIGISYGSTELATPALLSRRSTESDIYWLAPGLDRTVRIVDESGNECRPGQEGELQIQLTNFDCRSYLDDEETSAQVFRGGFFCPGDMAVSRADGRVRILGRTADVLNLGGQKVAVAPLELELQNLLKVEEVCLFSGLDGAGREQLVVVVQSDRELAKSERDQIVGQFPAFERIRFAVLKEFPRTATGTRKTLRSELRKLVLTGT
jgi:acyl-coenzyme A synthetase/AMP-(fatty) acid ligase